ncbi:hypothetical protein FAEPRAM212_01148 [Faecalibacterium prausnitzii M21/2]|uniref:Uncharacterized protein n=1 Tax=Faecalibacterium prausnitzii M21/2 TaxID=411485 RepID=A8S9U9_9FIRM|nr:hypothetical protein FAEPRAM212_01148 [Faecalibacterium prausnitzii M21/2]
MSSFRLFFCIYHSTNSRAAADCPGIFHALFTPVYAGT